MRSSKAFGGSSLGMAMSWIFLLLGLSVFNPQLPNSFIPGASAQVITTGIPGIGVRRELRKMMNDQAALNLYLVGMYKFQSLNQSDPKSWYQITGIHGAPYIPYDRIVGVGNNQMGYCEHVTLLFATWHRPYIALYEQIVYGLIQEFVSTFPQGSQARARYEAAAAQWRLPYWDWAQDASLPDIVANRQSVMVETPRGMESIPNPLFSYRFNPPTPEVFQGRSAPPSDILFSRQTFRDPSGPARIRNIGNSLRDRTYNALTFNNDFNHFATKAWNQGSAGGMDTLESVHDTIHGLIGGHMIYPIISAFDPIFWLHHTNIDRLLALWQAMFPESNIAPQLTPWGSFFLPANSVQDGNTPLAPFRRSNSGLWTSNACRDTRSLGYSYPEIQDTTLLSASRRQQAVRGRINQLYGRQAPVNMLGNFVEQFFPGRSGGGGFFGRRAMEYTSGAEDEDTAGSAANTTTGGNSGYGNSGSNNSGIGNSGNGNSGIGNSGTGNSGIGNSGTGNSGIGNSGYGNSGNNNSGYGSSATTTPESTAAFSVVSAPPAASTSSRPDALPDMSLTPSQAHKILAGGNVYREWACSIRVKMDELPMSMNVHLFLGEITTSPSDWSSDKNHIGTNGFFANAMKPMSSNDRGHCRVMNSGIHGNTIVSGGLPLTNALMDKILAGKLTTLNPDCILPYLQKNLSWKAQLANGTVLDASNYPSLKVTVTAAKVHIPECKDSLPKTEPWETYHEVQEAKMKSCGCGK